MRILFVQYTNPGAYPPLEHSSRILADAGWDVLFLGTGGFGADKLRFPPHSRITVREKPFQGAGWRQKGHYTQYAAWVLNEARRWKPNWIYASDPLSTPVALAVYSILHVPVIYHEHDSPGTAAKSAFMKFVLQARRLVARLATLCILPNEHRAGQFGSEMGVSDKVVTVWNCPALEELGTPRALPSDEILLYYHGSIVPSRLPPTVLQSMALLPNTLKLRVVGYETIGHHGYANTLRELASKLGIGERLEIVGSVSTRRDLLELCRQADIGISLMPKSSSDSNEQTMSGASNKPFDYLASGLALLVTALPDWCRMYVDPGYGIACDPQDANSIAAAISFFVDHRAEMHAMGERGRQRIMREWNYELQFAPVLTRLSA